MLAFACAALAAGCLPLQTHDAHGSSPVELRAVPTGAARICVLRPDSTAASVTMEIRDNGRFVGATRGATYFCYLATPGEHQITSEDDDTGPLLLTVRAGASYWLYEEVFAILGDLHAHLDWVDETTANEMLESCEARGVVALPDRQDEIGALPLVTTRRDDTR
ncbi:hypothetical protein AKJ09_00329 [Labilithrix luteola]|uniref:DUF2846 domain-containing protein n=2 Tax=Labilithrix luteola TaxID=1391654 RepID=A0A0K1PJG4_9BACT|nr:hypothetical protein AKJ09_00329 [Labilithrix luteola]